MRSVLFYNLPVKDGKTVIVRILDITDNTNEAIAIIIPQVAILVEAPIFLSFS